MAIFFETIFTRTRFDIIVLKTAPFNTEDLDKLINRLFFHCLIKKVKFIYR